MPITITFHIFGLTITIHIFGLTITIRINGRNRHSAQ